MFALLGVMSRDIGVVEVKRWYRNGMPTRARRTGLSVRRFETTVVGSPERPVSVPRRVCSGCDGDRVTDKREYGVPRTSNVASAQVSTITSEK